ncbi:MAG: GNAT family N-acetyltransferase [Tatlockia sp.]|jgi:predicted N-acetyltransferase YhbS
MIKIDLLKNHPETIPTLSALLYERIVKPRFSQYSEEQVKQQLYSHLQVDKLPLSLVAFYDERPVGLINLLKDAGIRPDLTPWIDSLVVEVDYQKRGLGQMLVERMKEQAALLHFKQLYLLSLEPTLGYYSQLGWEVIAQDNCLGHPVSVMRIDL